MDKGVVLSCPSRFEESQAFWQRRGQHVGSLCDFPLPDWKPQILFIDAEIV